jgi:hypothetical protein
VQVNLAGKHSFYNNKKKKKKLKKQKETLILSASFAFRTHSEEQKKGNGIHDTTAE